MESRNVVPSSNVLFLKGIPVVMVFLMKGMHILGDVSD